MNIASVPVAGIAVARADDHEAASAVGLVNFRRTLPGTVSNSTV